MKLYWKNTVKEKIMEYELKTCPFCNDEFLDIAIDKNFYSGVNYSYVFCSCGAKGPVTCSEEFDSETYEKFRDLREFLIYKAVQKWNRE